MELEEDLGHEIRQTPEKIRRRPFVVLKRGYLTCRGHIVVCVGVNVNDL